MSIKKFQIFQSGYSSIMFYSKSLPKSQCHITMSFSVTQIPLWVQVALQGFSKLMAFPISMYHYNSNFIGQSKIHDYIKLQRVKEVLLFLCLESYLGEYHKITKSTRFSIIADKMLY